MKKNANQNKKVGIAEEIAQLKQRRDDRKMKEDKKNQLANQSNNEKMKISDEIFEKMMRKKKAEIYKGNPSQVKHITNNHDFFFSLYHPIQQRSLW